jgi:hypothetical protein
VEIVTQSPDSPLDIHKPELILPPSVSNTVFDAAISNFIQGIPFASPDLSISNISNRKQLIYLPAWLVDCSVSADWESEAGFIYNVISHQDSYSDRTRQWQSKEVTEKRTRWEKRLGTLKRTYQNIPAPAIEEAGKIKKTLGDFLTVGQQQSYTPDLIKKASVRLPNRSTQDAWTDAEFNLKNIASEEVKKASKANYIRNFSWSPQVSDKNWTLLLYPVFSSYYLDDDGIPQPLMIHGQTGKISGSRKASMKKAQRTTIILMIIAAIMFLLGVVAGVTGVIAPFMAPIAVILVVLAGILAVTGFIALGIAWQFNRRNF